MREKEPVTFQSKALFFKTTTVQFSLFYFYFMIKKACEGKYKSLTC